jgi:hypothetical protein
MRSKDWSPERSYERTGRAWIDLGEERCKSILDASSF